MSIIQDFEPLLRKLADNPLKKFENSKETYLQLSAEEKNELYWELVNKFLIEEAAFDPGRGVPFAGFMKVRLSWHAHHLAEKLFNENVYNTYIDDWEYLPAPEPLDEAEHTINEDISFRMLDAISTLPARQKEVVERFYLQNWNMREIAEHLGVTEEACYRHRKLGIKKIKEYIEKEPLIE